MTVPLSDRLTRLAFRRNLHRRTVRMRLTLLYGALFLACGAGLLAITYALVAHATIRPYVRTAASVRLEHVHVHGSLSTALRSAGGEAVLASVVRGQRISDLHQLMIWSGIALAIMTFVAAGLGWIVAGRALRPLRTITATTREISARNLHRRLALEGPEDELKDLSATIDDLLTRLERSFQAQRAFVANASHELRTPLALSRAMLSFALTDPELTLDSLKATCQDVLDAGTDHEQLIEALLTLARSQQDLEHHETFDLAAIARDVIKNQQRNAADQQVAIDAALSPALVSGDPRLARTLLTNLVENALRYNVPHGRVNITLSTPGRRAALTISNSGPQVRADQVDRLLQPFRRLTPDRGHNNDGHGLGLSIVAAIATAHNATLNVRPRLGGGLHVKIEFPAVSGDDENAPPAADGALATAATMARRPVLTAWAEIQPTGDPRRHGCRESRDPG
jgi:signal transduction histidine kinase